MKLLRSIAFLLTLSALVSGQLLFAQQEVAPDHFDGSDAQVQKAAPVHHQKHAHSTMAKKGSAKHHHAHASA
jgi:hypothetical protein